MTRFSGVLVRFPSCRGSLPHMRRREADVDILTGNGGARKDLPTNPLTSYVGFRSGASFLRIAQCNLDLEGELVARGSAEMRERHTSGPRIGGVTSHADHE